MQFLFLNASIADARRSSPREGHVLVEDGFIREVADRPGGPKSSPAGERQVIDLKGKTLIPGLIDCHVHVVATIMNMAANSQQHDVTAVLRTAVLLRGMLDRGFTTVRDVGGAPYALAQAVDDGLVVGPRLIVCGKALTRTGGHMDARPPHDTDFPHRWDHKFGALGRIVDGVDNVRKACREELRQGAHFIKIMANGGVSRVGDPIALQGYSEAEMRVAVDEARDAQTYVSAHLYTADAIARAVRAGVHSLEHCNLIDAPTALLAKEAGAFVVPTLVVYKRLLDFAPQFGLPPSSEKEIRQVLEAGMRSLELLHKTNVPMAYGTDLLASMLVHQNEEFEIRGQVLPAQDVFASATTLAATLIGKEGELGIVEENARADLLVVDGNPLDDISLLARPDQSIKLVMKDGKIHKNMLN